MGNREQQKFEQAFRELFVQHYERLHRYAHTLLRDEDVANDMVQAVFTRLWEKKDPVVHDSGIKSYLYRSIHNLSLNELRREKSKSRYALYRAGNADNRHLPADALQERELGARIEAAIAGLPEQCRAVFLKSRREGKKYAEIAEEMNISVKTVEAQMSKALRVLREKLQDYLVFLVITWLI
ncbi:RNA polymerase sigma-70 factor [Chitinophaga lutea]|uniref:RNA polymerase sigma-70 factor n=1 Tax=Chitinophaga lutea TaxID=2488634 RepID=UPI001315A1B9|nr:RNA polymerase sigma-70 factor [Chitinophaga lutea]